MLKPILVSFALVFLTTLSNAFTNPAVPGQPCKPGENCKLPDCRCWDDPKRPGDFDRESTPQIILVTHSYAVNKHTVKTYMRLLDHIRNPNNCEPKVTFFVEDAHSDVETIKEMYEMGHEIAINLIKEDFPTKVTQWLDNIKSVRKYLEQAGIPLSNVTGLRGQHLRFGGNEEFMAMKQTHLTFDSSCLMKYPIWPFTTDYVNVNDKIKCYMASTLDKPYKGIWEFPEIILHFNGMECPLPGICNPEVNNTVDAFRMFFDNFNAHYYGNRAPFILDIDPGYLEIDFRFKGTKMFLDKIATYSNIWFLTVSQALEWIKNPVAISNSTSFKPWDCEIKI